jgi:putative DNA primase/helicase
MKTIEEVSKNNPCIHCGKPDWCYTFANSATVCKRGNIADGWIDSGKTDKEGAAILYPQEWKEKPPEPKVIWKTEYFYFYRDMPEAPLVKVIRQDLDNGQKRIFQNYHNGKTWIKTKPKFIERSEIPIYNLTLVKEAIARGDTIYVVEGEKCAARLQMRGLIATTNIGGCKGFAPSDVQDLAGAKRVVLIPDYDKPGLALMQEWAKHLPNAEWLYPFPHKRWDNPPASQGLDVYDWLQECDPTPEEFEAAIGVIPDSLKVKVETTTEPEAPKEYDSGLTYTEKAIRELYNHGGHFAALDGVLYQFNGKYYEQLFPELEKLRIREWAQSHAVYNPKTEKYTYPYTTPRAINAIWEWALISFAVSPNRVNPPGLNLANGVLKISWEGRKPHWELLDHSPENVYLYCSDVNYDPSADPIHCDRLLACLELAPRTALLRTIASALDLPTVRKLYSRGVRAGILRGAGSNGKDSLREAVSLIFGDSMVSVELSDFKAYDDGRKFYLAPLKHALVNWSSENNKGTSLDGLDSLNVCVTGERGGIKIEEKNKQPRPFTPQAIHLFNVNKIPRISSGLDSILSRFAIYDFNKTFKSNPDPIKGELQADPRFHDDPQFMAEQVCPAFLNRLLVELVAFCKEGIDYDSLKASLDDIQEESTHLWQFVRETGLTQDANGRVYVHDLWETLRAWYMDNGTLEVLELDNGKQKNIWNDQANKWDANVSGPNQIYKRFKLLFPKIERQRETQDPENKGRWFFSGISFNTPNSASPASLPYTASIPASPSGSLCFTSLSSASLEGSEAKSEANEASSEAETRSMTGGEASEAKNRDLSYSATKNGNGKTAPGLIYSDDDILVHMVNFEKVALGWTSEQLRDFVKAEFGGSAWADLSESQKINLVYKLRAIYSASPN